MAETLTELKERLLSEEITLFEKVDIIASLWESAGESSVPLLLELLGHSESYMRAEAALALGKAGYLDAVEKLVELVEDPDPEVRKNSVISLGRLGGLRAAEALKKATSDPSWVIRYFADMAIFELEHRPTPSSWEKSMEQVRGGEEETPRSRAGKMLEKAISLKNFSVKMEGKTVVVTAELKGGRKQRVYINLTAEKSYSFFKFHTICGKARPDLFRWVLVANARFPYGAVCLHTVDREDYFAISYSAPADSLAAEEVARFIEELAERGDWMEIKLTGGTEDRF